MILPSYRFLRIKIKPSDKILICPNVSSQVPCHHELCFKMTVRQPQVATLILIAEFSKLSPSQGGGGYMFP